MLQGRTATMVKNNYRMDIERQEKIREKTKKNGLYKAQFCVSPLTPLKLLEIQASNLTRLMTIPW